MHKLYYLEVGYFDDKCLGHKGRRRQLNPGTYYDSLALAMVALRAQAENARQKAISSGLYKEVSLGLGDPASKDRLFLSGDDGPKHTLLMVFEARKIGPEQLALELPRGKR